jgi:hypothetical protein
MKPFRESFADKIGTTPRAAIASIILVANAFVWYQYGNWFLTHVIGKMGLGDSTVYISSVLLGANVVGAVVAALLGVFIIRFFKRRLLFLKYWMLVGMFLSLMPLVFDVVQLPIAVVFFTLMGFYFGLGMPAAFAYFAASTETDSRARLGGIIFFVALLGVFFVSAFGFEGIAPNAVLLAGCKAVGLLLILGLKPPEKVVQNETTSYGFIVKSRPFLLYFVPWLVFMTINYMAYPVIISNDNFKALWQTSGMVENVLSGVLAVVFGFVADRIGRKRIVVSGFILLGLGYASLGLAGEGFGWWFYTVVDGIAWGMFYTVFIMTIWGDLSQGRSSDKYYAVGFIPFLLLVFIQSAGSAISSYVSDAIFSFASVFLFIAVLPLAYAPETLNLKKREFKRYVDKAMRVRLHVEGEPD